MRKTSPPKVSTFLEEDHDHLKVSSEGKYTDTQYSTIIDELKLSPKNKFVPSDPPPKGIFLGSNIVVHRSFDKNGRVFFRSGEVKDGDGQWLAIYSEGDRVYMKVFSEHDTVEYSFRMMEALVLGPYYKRVLQQTKENQLLLALANGANDEALDLLDKNPNLDMAHKDARDRTFLHVAAQHGIASRVFNRLIERGANIFAKDDLQRTPLDVMLFYQSIYKSSLNLGLVKKILTKYQSAQIGDLQTIISFLNHHDLYEEATSLLDLVDQPSVLNSMLKYLCLHKKRSGWSGPGLQPFIEKLVDRAIATNAFTKDELLYFSASLGVGEIFDKLLSTADSSQVEAALLRFTQVEEPKENYPNSYSTITKLYEKRPTSLDTRQLFVKAHNSGSLTLARVILEKTPFDIREFYDQNQNYVLYEPIVKGDLNYLKVLLEHNADANRTTIHCPTEDEIVDRRIATSLECRITPIMVTGLLSEPHKIGPLINILMNHGATLENQGSGFLLKVNEKAIKLGRFITSKWESGKTYVYQFKGDGTDFLVVHNIRDILYIRMKHASKKFTQFPIESDLEEFRWLARIYKYTEERGLQTKYPIQENEHFYFDGNSLASPKVKDTKGAT